MRNNSDLYGTKLKTLRFFKRNPYEKMFSIEELFEVIQGKLRNYYATDTYILPKESKGVLKRLLNLIHAWKNRKDINHITGDVHYLGIVLPQRKTVLTIHDCGELRKKRGLQRFVLWLFWFYWPVKRLKYITVISEQTKSDLISYVNVKPEKIRVIYNCIIGNYLPKQKPFNSEKPRILQVGITANKNIPRIINSLIGLKCTLVILGKLPAEYVTLITSSAIEYEVYYNLSRSEVINLYRTCDLLLYPSTLEGFGLPIIEAQATGIPVVTSSVSSMPEVAGSGACFVDPYDTDSITSGVLKVIKDEEFRNDIVKKGFENVKRFDPDIIASQYRDLYEEILLSA